MTDIVVAAVIGVAVFVIVALLLTPWHVLGYAVLAGLGVSGAMYVSAWWPTWWRGR